MNCTEFEEWLHDQLEASQSPRGARFGIGAKAELTEHAGECETCRALYERFGLLADCLGAWREQIPEVDLVQSVVAAHYQEEDSVSPLSAVESRAAGTIPNARSSQDDQALWGTSGLGTRCGLGSRVIRRRGFWLAAGSLVAIAAFALLVPRLAQVLTPSVPGRDVADARDRQTEDSAVPTQSREQSSDSADELDPVLDQAQVAYHELAEKAAGALDEVAIMFVRPRSPGDRPDSLSLSVKGTGWIDGLQDQLKPVGRSLDDAFDFLWQAGQSADPSKT